MDVDIENVETIDWQEVEQSHHQNSYPTVNGPIIIGCQIEIFGKCTSKKCGKKIVVPNGVKHFTCSHCQQRLDSSTLGIGFAGTLEIETDEATVELCFFSGCLKTIVW